MVKKCSSLHYGLKRYCVSWKSPKHKITYWWGIYTSLVFLIKNWSKTCLLTLWWQPYCSSGCVVDVQSYLFRHKRAYVIKTWAFTAGNWQLFSMHFSLFIWYLKEFNDNINSSSAHNIGGVQDSRLYFFNKNKLEKLRLTQRFNFNRPERWMTCLTSHILLAYGYPFHEKNADFDNVPERN